MATAYVSPAGSAAYPGTVSVPTSLATALSSAGAGDIVYLAPGSYRGTFTLGVSGTAGNVIQFIGDPKATQAIAGIAAGIVRITNYLSDTANPTDAVLFTATSRSYWSFSGIYFEGFRSSGFYAHTLTTCSNFSYDKCVFVVGRGGACSISTSAGVALNAAFTKCVFSVQNNGFATNISAPVHSGNYNLNLSYADCTANSTLVIVAFSNGNTNANGVTVYNCFTQFKEGVQIYTTNTAHPSYVYNSIFYSPSSFAIYVQGGGTVIENYNLVYGSIAGITQGANSFYAGSSGIDFGYSAINQLAGPLVNGPFSGSRLVSAGISSGAPLTDQYGTTWLTPSTPTMGAVEFATVAVTYLPTERNASAITIAPASTSQSIELYLGATGLTYATSGLAAYFVRNREAPTPITLVTQTPTGAWASGGFAEIDSSLVPGVYRLDVPNAAFAAGASDVTIVVRGASGTNGAVLTVTLSSGGLTAAQTASAVLDAVASIHNNAGSIGASIQDKAGYSLSTPQSFSTTGSVGSVTGNVAGNVTGIVGGVVGNVVGNITGSVATVSSPDNIIDGVWDEQRTGHTAAGSFGEKLQTNALADEMLARDLGSGLNVGNPQERTVRSALRALRNKVNVGSSQMVVKREDDTTDAWTASVTTTAVSSNVSGIDPD